MRLTRLAPWLLVGCYLTPAEVQDKIALGDAGAETDPVSTDDDLVVVDEADVDTDTDTDADTDTDTDVDTDTDTDVDTDTDIDTDPRPQVDTAPPADTGAGQYTLAWYGGATVAGGTYVGEEVWGWFEGWDSLDVLYGTAADLCLWDLAARDWQTVHGAAAPPFPADGCDDCAWSFVVQLEDAAEVSVSGDCGAFGVGPVQDQVFGYGFHPEGYLYGVTPYAAMMYYTSPLAGGSGDWIPVTVVAGFGDDGLFKGLDDDEFAYFWVGGYGYY